MPHCIIEYSNDLATHVDLNQLLNAVYQGTLASGLFIPKDIKTRAIAFDYYQTADKKSAFIHVTVRLLNGRSADERAFLSRSILAKLETLNLSDISLTVETIDLDNDSYAKSVIHRQ